jgi:hypothetical protein
MCEQEERIKRLEEEIAYLHRDMANVINIIENLQEPEIHYHLTYNFQTASCVGGPNNTNNLDELT